MNIHGIAGLSEEEIRLELDRGARFVVFEYCISIVVMTFKRPSDIFFIRAGESAVARSLPYILISLLFGWWGIPWGPIYTIWALVTDLSGGKDVTADLLKAAEAAPVAAGAP